MRTLPHLLTTAALVAAVILLPRAAEPETRVLCVATGLGPEANEASIEARATRFVARFKGAKVLFASGHRELPSVQVVASDLKTDDLSSQLALLFGRERDTDVDYRATVLPATGAATRDSLLATLDAEARALKPGDVLFGFLTGHGGRTPEPERRSEILLWNNQDLDVRELVTALDEAQPRGRVALVMTHCYSGGFADLVYEGGDPQNPLTTQDRCGFFATLPDREAAGCTPDARNTNDYGSHLLGAFEKPGESDLDKDGQVSLAEAHAYARVKASTIDIPVTTSEVVLRAHANTFGDADNLGQPIAKLLEAARPGDAYVLRSLQGRLALKEPSPLPRALFDAERLQRQLDDLDKRLHTARDRRDDARLRAVDRLIERWPWLENPYHSRYHEILERDGETIGAFIGTLADYKELLAADDEENQLDQQKLKLERKQALYARFIRAAENVVLEQVLRASAGPEVIATLDRLFQCENWNPSQNSPVSASPPPPSR